MSSSEGNLPPWDPGNKDQQTPLCLSKELHDKLVGGVPAAKDTLILNDVWAYLQQLGVVDLKEKNRLSVSIFRSIYTKCIQYILTFNVEIMNVYLPCFRKCIVSCSKNEKTHSWAEQSL